MNMTDIEMKREQLQNIYCQFDNDLRQIKYYEKEDYYYPLILKNGYCNIDKREAQTGYEKIKLLTLLDTHFTKAEQILLLNDMSLENNESFAHLLSVVREMVTALDLPAYRFSVGYSEDGKFYLAQDYLVTEDKFELLPDNYLYIFDDITSIKEEITKITKLLNLEYNEKEKLNYYQNKNVYNRIMAKYLMQLLKRIEIKYQKGKTENECGYQKVK